MLGVSGEFGIFGTRKKPSSSPSLVQVAIESVYGLASGILKNATGNDSAKGFTCLVMSFVLYIGFVNLLGMFLFSPTSHISVTIPMGMIVFMTCLLASFRLHKHHFFSMFVPSGLPLVMRPLMLVIELFSYLSRPFSLGMRLSANIIAGHVMLAVIASFAAMMGIFGVIPLAFVVLIAIFECAIGVFQAYIFVVLSSTYIAGAISEDH